MQVTLNIPDFTPLILNKDIQELKQTIKVNTALMLFKNAKLSLEQASSFANLSIYEFIEECNKNQIPVISYSQDELQNELSMMSGIETLPLFKKKIYLSQRRSFSEMN